MNSLFAPEFARAAAVLALICVAVVIGLLTYLSRKTGQRCFVQWTLSCLFYAVYLAGIVTLGDGRQPPNEYAAMLASTCVGLSAVFMIFGSLELADRARGRELLWLAVVTILLWSYVAAFVLADAHWAALPCFVVLGLARIHAGAVYQRQLPGRRGPKLLLAWFVLWGVHALVFPFLQGHAGWLALGHLGAAMGALLIATGLIVEQEVALAETKYRSVLDSVADAVFVVDLWTLNVLDANLGATRLTKWPYARLLELNFLELCPSLRKGGDNLLDHRNMFALVFKPYAEFHIRRADDTLVVCMGDAHLIQWQQRAVVLVRVHEAAADQKLGQLVRRAEKMSALGQLIAGVAHELNNPLAVVVGYAQLLAKRPELPAGIQDEIVKILHESERASKIVQDLLSFARPCEPQLQPVSINQIICNVLNVRERQLRGNNIAVEKILAADLPQTLADPVQIEQVLNNLVSNAIDAMITRPAPRILTVSSETNGLNIRVTVADTGPGIPADILGRIFDPFFTTKPPGKGTGLGLSISNTIIEEHRGKLWVETEPGRGAKFFVELPVIGSAVAAGAEPGGDGEKSSAAPVGAGPCRLLIVDDEPGIRDVLQAVLSANGYVTDTAADGFEALKLIGRHHYDLIISDLCMPEMDGEELYRRLQQQQPALAKRIVFATGDTVSLKSRAFLERSGSRWISKSFNISSVEELVRSVLRAGGSAEARWLEELTTRKN